MPRSFDWRAVTKGAHHGPRMWLQATAGVLGVLNAIALFLYLYAPGGSQKELAQEGVQVQRQIAETRSKAVRLKTIAAKVELGNTEATEFQRVYFLPKRAAYEKVIAEIQRMAQAAGLQEREAVYNAEPIEGTDDLSVLNTTAAFEGSYDSLMRFLHEEDRSPMLLILDALQAAPQQRGGQISAQIRFQTIVQEDAGMPAGEQQ